MTIDQQRQSRLGSAGAEMLLVCGTWEDTSSWSESDEMIQLQGKSPACSDLFPLFSPAQDKGLFVTWGMCFS